MAARLLAEGWQVHGVDVAGASLQHAAFQPQRVDLRAPAAVAHSRRDMIKQLKPRFQNAYLSFEKRAEQCKKYA